MQLARDQPRGHVPWGRGVTLEGQEDPRYEGSLRALGCPQKSPFWHRWAQWWHSRLAGPSTTAQAASFMLTAQLSQREKTGFFRLSGCHPLMGRYRAQAVSLK